MTEGNKKDDDEVSVKSNVLSIVSGFDSVVNEWEAIQRLEMIQEYELRQKVK